MEATIRRFDAEKGQMPGFSESSVRLFFACELRVKHFALHATQHLLCLFITCFVSPVDSALLFQVLKSVRLMYEKKQGYEVDSQDVRVIS